MRWPASEIGEPLALGLAHRRGKQLLELVDQEDKIAAHLAVVGLPVILGRPDPRQRTGDRPDCGGIRMV
jgi:hypothetical protein